MSRAKSTSRLARARRTRETKYDGDWKFDVRDGVFHHEPGVAQVFEVRPRKVLSFAKGDFAQTRFRFDG